jgi:segregation and condensation protein B
MADLNEKRVIEAALFMSARELTLEELRTLTGIGALGYLQNMVKELQKEYDERGSALEVIDVNGRYVMRIRNDYLTRVKQFAQDAEVSKSALRTLAYIAKHDGILKSELVKKLGPQIYEDVKELVGNGFVKTRKAGRTSQLNITDKFTKYFGDIKNLKHEPVMAVAPHGEGESFDANQTKIEIPADMPESMGEDSSGEEEKME